MHDPVTHEVDAGSGHCGHDGPPRAADPADATSSRSWPRSPTARGRTIMFVKTQLAVDRLVEQLGRGRRPRRRPCTAARRSGCAPARWPSSARAASTCWSPPTWPPAASTSTACRWSCTSTRRRTPRTTCTGPAARPGPASRARWSRWCCRGERRSTSQHAGAGRGRAAVRTEVTADGPALAEVTGARQAVRRAGTAVARRHIQPWRALGGADVPPRRLPRRPRSAAGPASYGDRHGPHRPVATGRAPTGRRAATAHRAPTARLRRPAAPAPTGPTYSDRGVRRTDRPVRQRPTGAGRDRPALGPTGATPRTDRPGLRRPGPRTDRPALADRAAPRPARTAQLRRRPAHAARRPTHASPPATHAVRSRTGHCRPQPPTPSAGARARCRRRPGGVARQTSGHDDDRVHGGGEHGDDLATARYRWRGARAGARRRGLQARGTMIAAVPVPYTCRYDLATDDSGATVRFEVDVARAPASPARPGSSSRRSVARDGGRAGRPRRRAARGRARRGPACPAAEDPAG